MRALDEAEAAKPYEGNTRVDHPPHYNAGKIEVIDAIEDWGLDFHKGNAVKYLARAGRKGDDEREDLLKARWFIDRRLALLEQGGESG